MNILATGKGYCTAMLQKNNDGLRRLLLGMLAFFGPIVAGAVTIWIGGFLAFWFLCYFIMLALPVVIIGYLVYKYIFQIAAEKVEDRFEEEGKKFLAGLKDRFEIIEDAVWDPSFRMRSRLSPRKPFDRVALSVSEGWFFLSGEQRQELMEEISHMIREWIREKGLERKNHVIRLDFYRDIHSPSSLVGKYSA